MSRTIILLLCAAATAAAQKKTVFVITDAEGISGICRQDQTETKDPELRALLAGETNAAVEGFFLGGADEVIVWDGHGGSATLSVTTIHPRARLVIGNLGPSMTLERGYAAVAFVGQHAKAGVRNGVMAHSYSSLGIQNIRLNGKPVGETETRTMLAGWYGVPVILLTGDQEAAAELKAMAPEAEVAVVKEGLGRYACSSLAAPAARDLVRDAARRSMAKIGRVKPVKVDGPVTIEIEYTTRNSLRPGAEAYYGGEQLDDRTIRYRGKDFLEAWLKSKLW